MCVILVPRRASETDSIKATAKTAEVKSRDTKRDGAAPRSTYRRLLLGDVPAQCHQGEILKKCYRFSFFVLASSLLLTPPTLDTQMLPLFAVNT